MTANTVPTPRFAAPPRASGHQLTSYDVGDGSRNVTHDDAGRVSSDGTQGFVFDDMGALARVDFAISGGTGTPTPKESYLYDIEGRLVASLLRGGSGEVYVSDGLQMVQSYADGTGALEWNATWGVGLDALISVEKSGTEYFALDDGKGSVVGWVQGTDVVARAEYTPEGRGTYTNVSTGVVCAETGSTRCGGSHLNLPFGFHSALQSRESGLLYFRNRWYSTETQQWLSQDPLDAVDSFDLYAFNAFDSVNNLDPLGLSTSETAGGRGCAPGDEYCTEVRDFKEVQTGEIPNRMGMQTATSGSAGDASDSCRGPICAVMGDTSRFEFLAPNGGNGGMHQAKSLASFATGIGAGFMCGSAPTCSGPPDPLLPEFAREHHGGVFVGGLAAMGFGSFEMMLGLRGLMGSLGFARHPAGIPLAAAGTAASAGLIVLGAATVVHGGAVAAQGLNAAMAAKGSGGTKGPKTSSPAQSSSPSRPSKPPAGSKAAPASKSATPKSDLPVRNAHLAGKKHPVTGVPFDKKGYPDFSKYKHPKVKDVRIELSGSRSTDFARANAEAGLKETPAGYTWHHHQDPGLMQLVETGPHMYTGHTGGFTRTP